MPEQLKIRFYEHVYRDDELSLGCGQPLHLRLTLLRVCQEIYDEARLTVTERVKLRSLIFVYWRVSHERRNAYVTYAQEIVMSRNSFSSGSQTLCFQRLNYISAVASSWLLLDWP